MFSVTLALESKFLSHSYVKWHLQSEVETMLSIMKEVQVILNAGEIHNLQIYQIN